MSDAFVVYGSWSLYFLSLIAICYFIGERYLAGRFGSARAYQFVVMGALVFAISMGAFGYIYGEHLGSE